MQDNLFEKEKNRQNGEAVEILRSVVEFLDDTRDEASRLNRLEVSEFAEKSNEIVLNGLDGIKKQLIELAQLYKFNVLSTDIKRSMSSNRSNNSVY
jgi:hypothetical protein